MSLLRIVLACVLLVGGVISLAILLLILGPVRIYGVAMLVHPNNAKLYVSRGIAYENKGEYDAAVADFEKAVELNPDSVAANNELGWLLSTCPEDKYRDGKKAIILGTKACELSRDEDPADLDTLAAAYAETGNFDAAVQWQNKAVTLGGSDWAREVDADGRLTLYKARHPYRLPR